MQIDETLDPRESGDYKLKIDQEIYNELRKIAYRFMSQEKSDHTFQPTCLVNEVYLKLSGQNKKTWESKKQFMGTVCFMMRRILVDHARAKLTNKRWGEKIPYDTQILYQDDTIHNNENFLIDLDVALTKLENTNKRVADVVKLKYFAGRNINEIADILEVSTPTVKRDWQFAKVWLSKELSLMTDQNE